MNIEELVKKHTDLYLEPLGKLTVCETVRNALTEQAETHAIELRAYEATVANLEQRVRELEEGLDYAEWAIAPLYSTSAMDEAGAEAANLEGFDRVKAETVWNAMLAAAPMPKKEGE